VEENMTSGKYERTINAKRNMSEAAKKISKEGRFEKDYIPWNKGVCYNFGEKRYNWKGGITPLNRKLRASSMWKIWREAIFLRDNFTCQNPNCEFCNNKMGVMLHPHHIKSFAEFPELRFVISNGITYCAEFHLNSKLLHKGILKEKLKNDY
jgi:hypothetical protein